MSNFKDDEQTGSNLPPSNSESSRTPLQERLEQDANNDKKRGNKKKGGSLTGYFVSGLAGVIVGALILWLLLPSLVTSLPGVSTTTQKSSNEKSSITQTATEVTSDITAAVEKASGAVVGITNMQEVTNGFWSQSATTQEAGSGSGVIYKVENGKAYIVTNFHVVDGAVQLEVTLPDGSKEKAELAGEDVWTDLAVIVISSEKVSTVATFGDSGVLKQGESVIAIGNPLGLDFYGSVTTGVVSGKDRIVPVDLNNDGQEDWQTEVLQTDAAINPGNSGGALVNINGDLVGINSMKIAENQVEGLGFAIPINSVIPVIEELERSGKMNRPTMGVTLIDLAEVPSFYQEQTLKLPEEITSGVVVGEVVRQSAAELAGVKQYDVIVEMDGEVVNNSVELRKYLYNEKKTGDKLKMKVYRQGQLVELELTLVESDTL